MELEDILSSETDLGAATIREILVRTAVDAAANRFVGICNLIQECFARRSRWIYRYNEQLPRVRSRLE